MLTLCYSFQHGFSKLSRCQGFTAVVHKSTLFCLILIISLFIQTVGVTPARILFIPFLPTSQDKLCFPCVPVVLSCILWLFPNWEIGSIGFRRATIVTQGGGLQDLAFHSFRPREMAHCLNFGDKPSITLTGQKLLCGSRRELPKMVACRGHVGQVFGKPFSSPPGVDLSSVS